MEKPPIETAQESPESGFFDKIKRVFGRAESSKEKLSQSRIEIQQSEVPDFVVEEIQKYKDKYNNASGDGYLHITKYEKTDSEDKTVTYFVSGKISKHIDEPHHGLSGFSGDDSYEIEIGAKDNQILSSKPEIAQYEMAA